MSIEKNSSTVPIKLFWWTAEPNFGDVLSRDVVAYVSGRQVEYANPNSCDLFGIGSLLAQAGKAHIHERPDGTKPYIWGTGLLRQIKNNFLKNVVFTSVRGPVTASILGLKGMKYGDPGLLASMVYGESPYKEDRIGIVPHWTQIDTPELKSILIRESALKLIDVRKPPETVCHDISSCRHIVSSSLHGLIVADSYGISNTWLNPVSQGHLKYHDYACSIGRKLVSPVSLSDIQSFIRDDSNYKVNYSDDILEARESILSSFPRELVNTK